MRAERYYRCCGVAVVDIGIEFELEVVGATETETDSSDSGGTLVRNVGSSRCRRTWSELIIDTRRRYARGQGWYLCEQREWMGWDGMGMETYPS